MHLAKISSALRVRTSTCRLHSCRLCSVLNLQERPWVSMQHASCRHSSSQIRPYFQDISSIEAMLEAPAIFIRFQISRSVHGIDRAFLMWPSLFQMYSCVRYYRLSSTIRISPQKHPPLFKKTRITKQEQTHPFTATPASHPALFKYCSPLAFIPLPFSLFLFFPLSLYLSSNDPP